MLTVINQNHVGIWQTTDTAAYCAVGEEEEFLAKIKRSFELNGRTYVVREIDETKLLLARKD